MNWLTLSIAGGCLLYLILKGNTALKSGTGEPCRESESETLENSEKKSVKEVRTVYERPEEREPDGEIPVAEAMDTASPETVENPVTAALESGRLEDLLGVVDMTQTPSERHQVLIKIVEKTYPLRHESDHGEIFFKYARVHLQEAPALRESLKKEGAWHAEAMGTFKMLAIAMEQEGRYDDALDICRQALDLGIENGTKTGFEGRIGRLEKKKEGGNNSREG